MLADLADIQPFNLSLVVLGNDLNFFSLQFQDSYQDSYVLFFHVWVSCCYGQENTQSLQTSVVLQQAQKEMEGKKTKKVKLLFRLPLLLPIATFAATMKSLVPHGLALTVYE